MGRLITYDRWQVGSGGGEYGTSGEISIAGVSQIIDQFEADQGFACFWEISARYNDNVRFGRISASWNPSGTVHYSEEGIADIGSTEDLEFNVIFSGGEVKLLGTTTLYTWDIEFTRVMI